MSTYINKPNAIRACDIARARNIDIMDAAIIS